MREAPPVEVNKIALGDSTEAADLAVRAYRKLSQLYEQQQKIAFSEFLVKLGVIRTGQWKSYPSGYRRVTMRLLNDVLVLQSMYADCRDIHAAVQQTKVPAYWRREQRCWLMRIIDKVRQALPTRYGSRSREQAGDRLRTLLQDDLLTYSFEEVVDYVGRYLEAKAQGAEAIGDEKAYQWRDAHRYFVLLQASLDSVT
ncbi:MAG: hypothetical protein ACFB4I_18625 [Cyanophyceae cyanobacterium]